MKTHLHSFTHLLNFGDLNSPEGEKRTSHQDSPNQVSSPGVLDISDRLPLLSPISFSLWEHLLFLQLSHLTPKRAVPARSFYSDNILLALS